MKGILFDNLDIDLHLTEQEFRQASIPELEIEGNKLKRKYDLLECTLQNMDGSDSGRNAHLQCGDFEEGNDGIRVEYSPEKETYFIKVNQYAARLIDERGCFGTRYGMGEKITIYSRENEQQESF